jgi:hypothetical protein
MPIVPLSIPNLLGGVSREAESIRDVNRVQGMDNVELSENRGAEKRPGSEFIESADGSSVNGELVVEEPTNTKHIFWLDRASGEQFVMIIDPTVVDTDKVVQIFDISDGSAQTVVGDGDLDDATAVLSDASNDNLRTYIASGTGDIRRRLKLLAVEDTTFLLNRTVVTALDGLDKTYRNTAGTQNIRATASDQNVSAWSNFEQPPSPVATYPTRAVLLAGPNIDNDAIWYARDDDVGQPQGFYWAVSGTQPPWFQRLPTEPANSMWDLDTMPIRIDFDGASTFTIEPVLWTDRFSGDSTLNPGPTFIGNEISDLLLHQDRLFFLSGEQIVSSRAGDLFNLWINSIILRNDADPIDQTVPGGSENRTNIIDFGIGFLDAMVVLTRGARQVELRANGPLSPNTAFLSPSTSQFTVEYMRPITMANKMYMMAERDFANILYAYDYDPERFANTAKEITKHIRNYIPAESAVMVASEQHSQIFITTDAATNQIYVYRTEEEAEARRKRREPIQAWYRWVFDSDNEILSINVFDDFLYLLIRKDSKIWLERIPLGIPAQDTDNANGTLQGLGYSIPIDRKWSLTGVYNAAGDVTEFTLPFEDDTIDELILGPAWDADFTEPDGSVTQQRLAGLRFKEGVNMTRSTVNDATVLTVDGDFQTNILGNDPLAFAGRSYKKDIELSRFFFRDERTGEVVRGNLQLMKMVVTHKDTGFYAVEVTPENRSKITHEFVVPRIGSTPLNSSVLESFGEFQSRIMSASKGVEIHITNDSPLPSAIVEIDVRGEFVPFSTSPVM